MSWLAGVQAAAATPAAALAGFHTVLGVTVPLSMLVAVQSSAAVGDSAQTYEADAFSGMVKIGGGAFVMGAGYSSAGEGSEPDASLRPNASERAGTCVTVAESKFWPLELSHPHAVTNAEYRAFRRATKYRSDAEKFGWSFVLELHATEQAKASTEQTVKDAPHWLAVPKTSWRYPQGPGSSVADRLDYPVVHMSWNDAKAYCKWAGKRLPTETEWEMAARRPYVGATHPSKPYPWGDEMPSNDTEWRLNLWQGYFPLSDAALDGFSGVAPADAFGPHGGGVYNMLGNVWEWTSTYFAKSSGQRVLRGGSYLDSADGSFNHMVSASTRMGNTEDSSADNMGFRCARESPTAPKHKPQGYVYDQSKKKRPPPGAGDPLKDGGKGAEELVQNIAAAHGAEGLQKWMDKQGMGTTVMSAADAMKKREIAAAERQAAFEAAEREAVAAASFDDLGDDEIREQLSKEEL